MDFTSNITSKIEMTSDSYLHGPNPTSDILQQSPVTLGLTGFVASLITFLAYLSYTPKIDKRSPAFTSDKTPFIGSYGFYSRRWSFWKGSVDRSQTGNFSFWLNKNHVVGVSGEAARKDFLENYRLDRVNASPLHGVGPEIVPPVHAIFRQPSRNGHSYFQRCVLDLVKSEHLSKHLPRVAKDARDAFQILAKNPSGVMKPIDTCYGLVLKQSVRVMCTDEIADTPKLMDTYFYYTWILQHIASGHTSATPWLPSLSHMKRRWCRSGLQRLLTPLVNRRMEKGAPRVDDTLQNLIDNGDSKDFIITCLISLVFISVANAGKLLGVMLKTMAQHTDWQEKAYSEIKAVVKVHAMNKDAPLVEQLSSIPLEAWESDFPMIDRCFKEAIRLHVSFPMLRQNMSSDSIRIPGSNEVIPAGSFVGYYTSDAHQNEDLYPNPTKLDPDRWLEGSDISKKQSYSFLSWGNGRHRCVGQRWAKLQDTIIIVHALAMYEWRCCDENGVLIAPSDRGIDLDTHGNKLAQGVYCKYTPREKA